MRVIAGRYKRRSLIAPEGDTTRPTADRVKENLFNIIAPELEDCVVLDLFAGSGSLGIEALSRGAKKAVFVENNRSALSILKKNLQNLEISEQIGRVIPKKVEDFLAIPSRMEETFDIIFADPPYQLDWLSNGLLMLEKSGYCSSNCLLIFEKAARDKHEKEDSEPVIVENWSLQDIRKYGKTRLEFWRRNYD